MKKFEKMQNEEALTQRVIADALNSGRASFIIQAGHFPLYYNQDGAYAATNAWNAFTPYSMELGARIGKELKNNGVNVKFVILADDINYEDFGQNALYGASAKTDRRRRFYKEASGENGKIPSELENILLCNGFSKNDVIRQNQGKMGREDSLVFSEKVLRSVPSKEKNQCARSYRAFLSDLRYFDSSKDYLISFIPDRCTGNICNRVLEESPQGLYSSHIFMQTDSTLLGCTDKKSIWEDWGVYYRGDSVKG